MSSNAKLGTLRMRPREDAPGNRRRLPLARYTVAGLLMVGLAITTGLLIASGFVSGMLKPRKIVVRGNSIVDVRELLSVAGAESDGTYFQWMGALGRLDDSELRWLDSVSARPEWGRTLLVSVSERLPLLHVQAADGEYWLCDDLSLTAVNTVHDTGKVFEKVRKMPRLELEGSLDNTQQQLLAAMVSVAAGAEEVLPGSIETISADRDGMLWLEERSGLRIKLGGADRLREKLGALPKALRICAQDRDRLKYLDASDPQMFYEKWIEPPETES